MRVPTPTGSLTDLTDDDRVDEVVEAVRRRPGALDADPDDLLAQQPAHGVELVNGRVVDGHARRVALRDGGVAVVVVDQQHQGSRQLGMFADLTYDGFTPRF